MEYVDNAIKGVMEQLASVKEEEAKLLHVLAILQPGPVKDAADEQGEDDEAAKVHPIRPSRRSPARRAGGKRKQAVAA